MLSVENNIRFQSSLRGVFIDRVRVKTARCISGEKLEYKTDPVGLGVELALEIGRTFTPIFQIYGRPTMDGPTITGWGGAFVVRDLFVRLGIGGFQIDDNARIPDEYVKQLVDKEFYRLQFVSGKKLTGKIRWSSWMEIANIDEGPKSLEQRFVKSLHKGYPKNYKPETLDLANGDDFSFDPKTLSTSPVALETL